MGAGLRRGGVLTGATRCTGSKSCRPRYVCSRADIESDNDHSDTPATMSIDGLLFPGSLSSPCALRSCFTECSSSLSIIHNQAVS